MSAARFVKKRIFAPGPVEVPPAVLEALGRPVVMHRGPEFRRLLGSVREMLAEVACVPGDDVLVVTGSGTAAFEAVLATALPAPAKVLALSAGKFGERWASLAARHGHQVVTLSAPWGRAIETEQLAAALERHPDVAAVTTTHSETSTGVLHDVAGLAAAVRERAPSALVIVDAVTSLAAAELRPLEWGLDAIVSGSQKGVMVPPGLGFAWLSEKAWRAAEGGEARSFYLDLRRELRSQRKGETAFTPAVNLISGLEVALAMILEFGVDRLWAHRGRLNDALLAAGVAAGLTGFAERPSPAVAALRTPQDLEAPAVVRHLAEGGITISGGQDEAKPYLLRPSLLGWADDHDAVLLAGALERALRELGAGVTPGSAVAAALSVLERPRLDG